MRGADGGVAAPSRLFWTSMATSCLLTLCTPLPTTQRIPLQGASLAAHLECLLRILLNITILCMYSCAM